MKAFYILALSVAVAVLVPVDAQESSQGDSQQQTSATSVNNEAKQDIKLGSPVQAVDPAVPKSLYGKNATAVLKSTINTDGAFTDLSAIGGDQDFEEAALDAVHQWRYMPATLNGIPVEANVFVTFFLIRGEIKSSIETDQPYPIQPKRPVAELYSRGELFVVDPKHPPKAIVSPDPEYTEAARAARHQGIVVVGMILGRDGRPRDLWVVTKLGPNGEQKTIRRVGFGLEHKAIEAVRQWKFEPAMKDGEPVPVLLNVEIQFRLY